MAPNISFAAILAISLWDCITVIASEATITCLEGSSDCQAIPNLSVVAFTGSLRKASCNSGLLRYAVEAGTQFGLDITIISADLPLFNPDLEYLLPASVVAFRGAIEQSDAVLLGVDEINYSYSGTLKNALDWASRSYANKPAPFAGKPVDLMSIGMNGFSGGTSAQAHLRQVLLEMDARAFGKPEVQLTRRNPIKNDQNGTLINQLAKGTVRANLEAFAAFVRKSQPGAR